MIRINLLPSAKRSARKPKREPASKGSIVFAIALFGWGILGGGGYWLLDNVQAETAELRQKTSRNKKRADEIRKLIDEEGLKARQEKVEQMRKAIEVLERQRRTPVFVLHELANILTTGRLPDIDEEKQRKLEAFDPHARLDLSWDASSVWFTELNEDGANRLRISGGVRDPSDLDEFLKRIRSSARFGQVSHPEFSASNSSSKPGAGAHRFYTFTLTATVNYWN